MEDFFGNLGKRITDTVEEIGKKAEDTLEIQKITLQNYEYSQCAI